MTGWIGRDPPQAAAARWLAWPVGGAVLGLSLSVVRVPAQTTYGGTWPPLLWLEVVAALGLLMTAALIPASPRAVVLAVAGATWLVPELAGWASGPPVLGTAADAWSRVLPALLLAGALPWRRQSWARASVVLAVAGGVLAAGARVLLVDPFLDPDCWRRCDHNPVSLPGMSRGGELLDGAGSVLLAAAVVAGVALLVVPGPRTPGRGRTPRRATWASTWARVAAAALVTGLAGPVGLRVAVPESATRPAYLACSCWRRPVPWGWLPSRSAICCSGG